MRRQRVLLAGLLLTLTAGALLWMRGAPAPPAGGARAGVSAAGGTRGGPTLVGQDAAPPAAGRSHEVPEPQPSLPIQAVAAVTLVVTDEAGRPLPAAWARLHPTREGAATLRVEADGAGLAHFAEVEVGEAWVHVDAPGFVTGSRGLSVRPGTGARAELRLVRTVRARGLVLLPSGDPAAGAEVAVQPGGSAEGRTVLWGCVEETNQRVRADAAGAFEVELAPGAMTTLMATLSPHAPASRAIVPRTTLEGLVLQLGRGSVLRGVVRTPLGATAARAEVFVVPAGVPFLLERPRAVVGPGGSYFHGGMDDDVCGMSECEGEGEIQRAWRARADAEGRFEVACLPRGAYLALAQGSDGARGAGPQVELGEAAPQATTEVRLEPRARLRVRVLGPDGKPVAARLSLEGAREHFLWPRVPEGEAGEALEAEADPEAGSGSAVPRFVGLVGGDYVLVAQPTGCIPLRVPVRVPPVGEAQLDVQGVLGRTLRVEVVETQGGPVAEARLRLHLPPADGVVEQTLDVVTDAHGRATFEGLQDAPGRLHVSSETHVGQETPLVRPGEKPLRVVLERLPRLTCRLRLEGVNLTHDYVWVEEHGPDVGSSRTGRVDAQGLFTYVARSVDQEALFVLLPWEGARVVLGRHRLRAGETLDLGEVRVDRGREIQGRVRLPGGLPAEGVVVRATLPAAPPEDDGFGRPAPTATTDVVGRFVLRGVHHGPAVVRTRHPTWAPAAVGHDGTGPALEVELVAAAWLEGSLSGGRWVLLRGPDNVERVAMADAGGRFRLGPLPAGRHLAEIHAEDARAPSVSQVLELEVGETRRVAW